MAMMDLLSPTLSPRQRRSRASMAAAPCKPRHLPRIQRWKGAWEKAAGKVSTVQAQGQEFEAQHPCKNQAQKCTAVCKPELRAKIQKNREDIQPEQGASGSVRDPGSKDQVEST